MQLIKKYVTNNRHYKNNKIISVKRLVLHSVGTPQPSPDVFYNTWNKASNEYLTQIVVGVDKAYEVLPCMDTKGKAVYCWHVGEGNGSSIGVELTEPSTIKYTSGANWKDLNPDKTKAHVLATYNNAVDIFAQLCKFHDLNPVADGVILSHSECYKRGIGTNHGDVEHIWNKFGLTMNQFRKDVKAKMESSINENTTIKNSLIYDDIVVGKVYKFKGNTHYVSANSTKGSSAKPSRVKVTKKYFKSSKHPISVRSVDSVGNYVSGNVYGWVDIKDLESIKEEPFLVKVTALTLNIRRAPGIMYSRVGVIGDMGVYTIVETQGDWGLLKSYQDTSDGWINLKYTKRI